MRAFPVLPPVGRRATAGALDIRASVGTSTSPTNSLPNLLQQTEAISTSPWSVVGSGVSVSTNVTTGPNGASTADQLTGIPSGTEGSTRQDVTVTAGVTYTFSAYVKQATSGSATHVRLTSNNASAWSTGGSTKVALTSNWQRVSVTWVQTGSTTARVFIGNFAADGSIDADCAGNVLVAQTQLEAASAATTYIGNPVINKAVTGVGFTPKVVLPWGVAANTEGAALALVGTFGAMTGSAQAAISPASQIAVTTSRTYRRHTATSVVSLVQEDNGTVPFQAARSSLDADGFTLNWDAVVSPARILNHIALGGADLEVSLTQQQMNSTNLAQSFAHGLSGAPTGVLFFGIQNQTAPANTTTFLCAHIGAWAGSSQWSAAALSSHGLTTTLTRRMLSTTAVSNNWNGVTGANSRSMAVSSVDATNVNVTYPVTTDTTQNYFYMLAIRGAKCQVGTFDCNGSTSPLSINTTGITPKLFLPVFVPLGVDNVGTVLGTLRLAIGASDGTNSVSCGITDQDSQTTTNARRFQSSTTLAEYDTGGTKAFEATAAFSGESVVVTPTTNGGTLYGQGGYLVIGS